MKKKNKPKVWRMTPKQKVYLKICHGCKSKFIGSIDPSGKYCSTSCLVRHGPLPEQPEKEKEKERIGILKSLPKRENHINPRHPFYSSWEWTEIRYAVFKRYGRECMLCGSTKNAQVDHIKPISRFPNLALEFDNLQILCKLCNKGKSNKDCTDWRPK